MDGSTSKVAEADLPDLTVLLVAYCDFYRVAPGEQALRDLALALLEDPSQGVQLIARNADGDAVGFATVFWTWQTLSASRTGVMNDLYVTPGERGRGWADALIKACAECCAARSISTLVWQTALDNERAQAVYRRVGAKPERWLDWSLDVTTGS